MGMKAPAAIQATFADFKLIRGRKVAQLVFEVPIEQTDAALTSLGGLPSSVDERWCALCRLDLSKAKEPARDEPQKPKRKMAELPLSQQAALLCEREAFWRYMREFECYHSAEDNESATAALRHYLGINSRSEIVEGSKVADAFLALKSRFEFWLNEP